MLDSVYQDSLSALRALRNRSGTSLLAVIILASGLGMATAILGVVNGVLLSALPYPQPAQLVAMNEVGVKGNHMAFARPNAEDFIDVQRDFSTVGLYAGGATSIATAQTATRGGGAYVAHDFFRVLGIAPALGRTFGADERDRVAVIGHSLWLNLFGGNRNLGDMYVDVFGEHLRVIGVMPAGFAFPPAARVWLPDETQTGNDSRTAHNWRMIARLASADALPQARTAAQAIAERLKTEFGDSTDAVGFSVTPLRDTLVASVRPALWVLGAGALLLLLIASVNTINLLMAMTWSRSREFAVRAAMGARAGRLARHIVMESVVLMALAVALGLIGAHFVLGALVRLAGDSLPRAAEVHVGGGPVYFMLGFAALLALIIGTLAARNSIARADTGELRSGGRGMTLGRPQVRLQVGLLIAQTAVAAMLLVGAGLLGRTFLALLDVDAGFQPQGALSVRVSLPPPSDDAGNVRVANRHADLMRQFAVLPGVTTVGGTNALPLTDDGANGSFFASSVTSMSDFAKNPQALGYAEYRVASPDYFVAAGIPLEKGRAFTDADQPDSLPVALISRSLARSVWGENKAIGQAVQFGNMDGDLRPLTVVGIVGDVHENALDAPPRGTIYVALAQRPQAASEFSIVVRGTLPIAQMGREVRGIMTRSAPDIPFAIAPLSAVQASSLGRNTFTLVLFGVFAGVALALTIGGIYALMAFTVGQRRNEFALRQALGCSRSGVARLVLARGLRIGVVGLVIGLIAGLAGARALRSLLFGVAPFDPWTLLAVAVVLLGTLCAACLLPAWRASATAPRAVLD